MRGAPDASAVLRAWIADRDQMHAWVAISVGLSPDEMSQRMTGKIPWEAEVVEDVRCTLAVSEDEFWNPPPRVRP